MSPALPVLFFVPYQPEISLVHKGCGLQKMAGPFAPKLNPGELLQFGIDQFYQPGRRRIVTRLERAKKERYLAGLSYAHAYSIEPAAVFFE
jgi:hypothetical protein